MEPSPSLHIALIGVALSLAAACNSSSGRMDANALDAVDTVDVQQPVDVPLDLQPASTAHCTYAPLPPTAHAGGTVTAGAVQAGAAEAPLDVPIGTALGAYTARAKFEGTHGQVDARSTEMSAQFQPSVGVETTPMVRAVALTAGDETVVFVKADLALAYDGITEAITQQLGPAYAGKVVFLTSHSHSSFGQYTANSALAVGLGVFRELVFQRVVSTAVQVAQQALAARVPAVIGIAHDGAFDPMDLVGHDRRSENDDLPNGLHRKDHDLFVVRVDTADHSTPIAVLAVFGVHGTVNGEDNNLASTDAPGSIERRVEEQFGRPVVVMHLQGAAGDVSPSGTGGIDCTGAPFCYNFARVETIGRYASDAIMAAWTQAGTTAQGSLPMEMVTRVVADGPDWHTFTVRNGALSYAPFGRTARADGMIFSDPTTSLSVISPIDEFNAPYGAALCGGTGEALVGAGQMPGTNSLRGYSSCFKIDTAVHFLGPLVGISFEPTPLCASTRTTVSALRIGDYLFATLPGEPVSLLADHVRALSPVPADHTVVVGYAQDHVGYLLTAEDWLRGGYEPSINMWGPLEAEYIAERSAEMMQLAMTPAREDAAQGGVGAWVTPTVTDPMPPPDPAPLAGTVPMTIPTTVYARGGVPLTNAQPVATVPRLTSARFVWIGEDPETGTPRVTLQRDDGTGTFADVVRHSGRPVQDHDVLLTYTPDPLVRVGTSPRTHYWVTEWQAVGVIGTTAVDDLSSRVALPLGRYRFRVQGTGMTGPYTLTSQPFTVVAGAMDVTVDTAGTTLTAHVGYNAAGGYRLLDLTANSNQHVPLRSGTVDLLVTFSDGTTQSNPGVVTTSAGDAVVTIPGSRTVTAVRATDAAGNAGGATH